MRALAVVLVMALAVPVQAQPVDWDPYHRAFVALTEGRRDEARALLEAWLAAHPDHPEAVHVHALAQRLAGPLPVRDERDQVDDVRAPEKNTAFARAEVAFFSTLLGIAGGVEICVLFEDCTDSEAVFLIPALGAGAGLTAALLLTRNGITPGHAATISSGGLWGTWVGGATAGIAEVDDRGVAGLILGGQVAGVIAGEIGYRLWRPTAGQVSMASSTGIWAGALTLFTLGALDLEPDDQAMFATGLGVSLAGLGLGMYLANRIPMSRGRVFTIDAGGVVGGLIGLGAVALIQGDDLSAPAALRGVLPGAVVGLVAATWITRHWDRPARQSPVPAIAITPTRGGAALLVSGQF